MVRSAGVGLATKGRGAEERKIDIKISWLADEWERQNPCHGRLNVIRIGILLGLGLSIVEGLGNRYLMRTADEGALILFWWNLSLRSGYAIAVALTQPVLDGLILAHLKREGQNTAVGSEEYGRERVHGKDF